VVVIAELVTYQHGTGAQSTAASFTTASAV
jgi:hypothetical protein